MNGSPYWQQRRSQALARALAKQPERGGVAQVDADEGYLYRPGQRSRRGAVDQLRSETSPPGCVRSSPSMPGSRTGGVDLQAWSVPE